MNRYLNTKLEVIPLPNGEEEKAWGWFTASPMKHVLHNEIVRKILALRDQLEKAEVGTVPNLQSEIKAHREFLGLIHRKDALPSPTRTGL